MRLATSADKDRTGEPGWAKDMAEVLVGMFEQEVAAAAAEPPERIGPISL